MDNVPKNIGVVVSTHPTFDVLKNRTLEFMKLKYKNFIFKPEFLQHHAVSQYLIAGVDGIINVSSAIGFQTLIWDIKNISMGTKYFDFIADSKTLGNIEEELKKPQKNRNNVLYWILTRYAINEDYMNNPQWLYKRLTTMLEKFRTKGIDFEFFDEIDSLEKILDSTTKYTTFEKIDLNKRINNTNFMNSILSFKEFLNKNKDKKIAFYGAGVFAREFLEITDLKEYNIVGVIDKDKSKSGSFISGYEIFNPDQVKDVSPDVIAILLARPWLVKNDLVKLREEKNLQFEIESKVF